jgi:hypothetical protein
MATTLRIKRRVSGSPGAPAALKSGELAWNMADGIIYGGKGDDGGGNATSVVAIAKDGFVDPATLYQPLDADLIAIAGLDSTAGILVKTGANAYTRRSLTTAAATRIAITNGDGSSANPIFDLGQPTIGGSGASANITKVTVDVYGRVTNTAQASLSDLAAPTATYSVGAQLIQSSATPSGSNDLTNKAYVDQAILNAKLAGDDKDSVRVASTAQQALSGGTAFPTIDGVATAAGNRVLLRAQTAPAENGIYVVGGTAGSWTLTRATDFDAWTEIPGAIIPVEEGTVYADAMFISSANAGGTLGTTAINFIRVDAGAGGGFTVAGAGLTSSGATVDVVAGTGITVASDNVALTGQALALHNATIAADQILYGTGAGTFSTSGFTGVARTLVAQTTQALMRSTGLGLGTIATQDANAVAITGGTIDGVTLDGGTF